MLDDAQALAPLQAREAGHTLEQVPSLPPTQNRVCCDLCATSIPNLHLQCAACQIDVCMACCREEGVSLSAPTCLACAGPATMVRVLPTRVLDALQQAPHELAAYLARHGGAHSRAVLRADGTVGADAGADRWRGREPEDRRLAVAWNQDKDDALLAPRWSLLQSPEGDAVLRYGGDGVWSVWFVARAMCVHRSLQGCVVSGVPFIVRNTQPHVLWTPNTLLRASRTKDAPTLNVVDCATWKHRVITCVEFFKQYARQKGVCRGSSVAICVKTSA